ncbi:LemA family protein [Candidatus Micrarchaeota archaeon]|nr:LemA family protein [Candidatus Micrarchaeota archaeon]
MDLFSIILSVVVLALVLFFVLVYNHLITARNSVDHSWSQIDVQLKKRSDLIPNLIQIVKKYLKHEEKVFTKVTEARSKLINAEKIVEKANANEELTSSLKKVFAVAEAYPKLRATENFKELQLTLSAVEEKIAYSRQFYNEAVLYYNTAIQLFPNNLIAGLLGFTRREFFEATESEKKSPKAKF